MGLFSKKTPATPSKSRKTSQPTKATVNKRPSPSKGVDQQRTSSQSHTLQTKRPTKRAKPSQPQAQHPKKPTPTKPEQHHDHPSGKKTSHPLGDRLLRNTQETIQQSSKAAQASEELLALMKGGDGIEQTETDPIQLLQDTLS